MSAENAGSRISKAIILAAGRGTRLGRLTADRPKPMIPVAGFPVLEHIVRGIAAAGVNRILIVVGYRGEAIQSYFGDGEQLGMTISYVWQERPNGTGGALALGLDFAGDDPILASYGDILTDPNHYRNLLKDYAARPSAALLGINPMADTSAGAAVYREGDSVVSVEEKPPAGTAHSHWNLAGISVYGPAIWGALDRVGESPRGEKELTEAIARLIEGGETVRAYELHGFWSDIGTPVALAEAERDWTLQPDQDQVL